MATANIDEGLLDRNIAYFKDTLLQIQYHNFNWEYEKAKSKSLSRLNLFKLAPIIWEIASTFTN